MYLIEISNQNGSFSIGTHKRMKMTKIKGIGIPSKSTTHIEFIDVPGVTTTSVKDNSRTITIAGDFYGNRNDVQNIYRVISEECEIRFIVGTERRMIRGRCINPEDIERICNGIYSYVLQFECSFPYFEDFRAGKISIRNRIDQFPNTYENGKWYVTLPAVATERTTNATVVNRGDFPVFPLITISNLSEIVSYSDDGGVICIANDRGGRITLNHNFQIGEIVTVDLGNREIHSILADGSKSDITGQISDDTVLSEFRLLPGENHISVRTENTSTNISCVLEYKNLYNGVVLL